MRFSYKLLKDSSGWVAECVDIDAAGTGKSPDEAIASLRSAIEEKMLRPDAVAPPSEEPISSIELEPSPDQGERASLDLGGPGEPART